MLCQFSFQLRAAQPGFVDQPVIAEYQVLAVDATGNSTPSQGLEILNVRSLELQPSHYRFGNRVVGT
ncbi:hypothetical protein D9M73_118600 [compost metagenome]